MRQLRCLVVFVLALASGFSVAIAASGVDDYKSPIDIDWKNPGDQRQMRKLVLPNQLEVLLVSDPSFKLSAVAVDVNVGSYEEPENHLGMAHFLEHVLFLGTKKYPKVGDYRSYLAANQGNSNAYTGGEHTNYYLEVDHDAFAGALDRFSQFFIEPTFDAEFVSRELNAVNSEYQKNLQDDMWRMSQLQRSFYRKGHPESRFTIGNSETLGKTTRDDLIAFYQKYYSANVMKAAILGRDNLDNLAALAKKYLSPIVNKNRTALKYDTDIFDDNELPRLISAVPIKDSRELIMSFETPSPNAFTDSRPHGIIGHLIGHEGKGSLLSLLKKKGLVTGLSAGASGSSYAGVFEITITLTEKGVEKAEEVMNDIFAFVNLVRKEGYKPYVYKEIRAVGDINYVFREFEEGGDLASRYARLMHLYPALEIDRNIHMLSEYSSEDFDLFLDCIQPQKMQAFLIAKGVKTDQVEPYFSVQYGVKPLTKELVTQWANGKPTAEVTYPGPNSYIPSDLTLLNNDPAKEPYTLLNDARGTFFFEQDKTFNIPKGRVELNLITTALNASPRDRLLGILYERALAETLNEWRYPITLAELSFAVSTDPRGVKLVFGGYSQHISHLMLDVIKGLKTISINEETFAAIKDQIRRELASQTLEPAYRQGLYELRYLSETLGFHFKDYAGLVEKISLQDVVEFAHKRLFAAIGIEGVAVGNLTGSEVKAVLESIHRILGAKSLPKDRWPVESTVRLPAGHPVAYSMTSKDNNNSFLVYHVFGVHSPKASALTRLMDTHLSDSFFTELRTRQQLGYIVHSARYANRTTQGLLFLIQSQSHEATDVATRVRTWLDEQVKTLSSLTDARFKDYQKALVTPLREPEKTQDERLSIIHSGSFIHNGDFAYRSRIADAIESTTRKDLEYAIRLLADPKYANYFAIYTSRDGAGKPDVHKGERAIKSIEQFKRKSSVWVLDSASAK